MGISLANAVEAPDVFADSTGVLIGLDFGDVGARVARQGEDFVILQKLPLAVIFKIHDVSMEF